MTLFKTIIKVKDRQNFKDKFLEEPYSTETISETFEPAPVLLRLQGLTMVLKFLSVTITECYFWTKCSPIGALFSPLLHAIWRNNEAIFSVIAEPDRQTLISFHHQNPYYLTQKDYLQFYFCFLFGFRFVHDQE